MRRHGALLFITGIAIAVAGCHGEPAPIDTTQRSMPVPVPSSGVAGQPEGPERDIFDFPRRAKQDPSKLDIRTLAALGPYIVDAGGRALYSFSGDAAGHPACLTNCATVWPPVIVEGIPRAVDASIAASLLSLVTRPDGKRQLVFNEMPLYYFDSDRASEPTGHSAMSFGGRFTLVAPDGKPVAIP
jgi:predicted lipoprotein with Yx(FWY)xxD motif